TRVHCSPVSIAMIHAAAHALAVNRDQGEWLREQLARRVLAFRAHLARIHMKATGGLFPVQTLVLNRDVDTIRTYQYLRTRGILTVLHRAHHSPQPRLSFLLTAEHHPAQIARASIELEQALRVGRASSRRQPRRRSHEGRA